MVLCYFHPSNMFYALCSLVLLAFCGLQLADELGRNKNFYDLSVVLLFHYTLSIPVTL